MDLNSQLHDCLAENADRPGDLFPPRCTLLRGHHPPHRTVNPWASGAVQWTDNEVDRD